MSYSSLGKFEAAIEFLQKAIELEYDESAVFELAVILYDQEDYQKANLYFKQLDTLSPDFEGYEYIYAAREYLSGTNAEKYEQVFGEIKEDGSVSDTLPEGTTRASGNTYLYQDGILTNRLYGDVQVSVTKDWKAALSLIHIWIKPAPPAR